MMVIMGNMEKTTLKTVRMMRLGTVMMIMMIMMMEKGGMLLMMMKKLRVKKVHM